MNKNSITDYISYILVRALGSTIRILPREFSLFLGRRLGDLLYYFDAKHKALAYANIKTALGSKLSPTQLNNITHKFYQAFGQNLIEIFFIPIVNKKYMDKYVTSEGLEFIYEAFKKGKGVILLGVHSGSWELSNILCANLGFSFSLFVRDLRHPYLNKWLNMYRSLKGCKIVQRQNQTRQLIEVLKNNEAIGITLDQGGKAGELVKFFGKDASMATGAIRLALRYNSVILPAFYTRVRGPYIKAIIEPPFNLTKTQDEAEDIHRNLQELVRIFEKNIEKYAKDYLWSYKIWKYADEKNILILSDAKAGHLRQAQAVANIASRSLKDKGITARIDTAEVKFKSNLSKKALVFSSALAGKYHCQGCLWCLRKFLQEDTYEYLARVKPDIIISCGSAIVPINFVLSRENLAKSIVIMRPSILSVERFNLAIIAKHDNPRRRRNIAVTEGALNLVDDEYLRDQREKLMHSLPAASFNPPVTIGLLIGGDTKNFLLKKDTMLEVSKQIKSVAERLNADILITTSRRTSQEIEVLMKEEFKDFPRCKLLIITKENNIPEAVGGILGLSQIIITSPESISMISEAANSKKFVFVFKSPGLRRKHQRFLDYFAKNKYIYLTGAEDLGTKIEDIWLNKPQIRVLSDNIVVSEAMKRIL